MESIAQIVVFPRGQLSAKDKERLTKSGVIAIEADNPAEVHMLMPEAPLVGANSMLMAALEAMSDSSGDITTKLAFVKRLHARMHAAEIAGKECA